MSTPRDETPTTQDAPQDAPASAPTSQTGEAPESLIAQPRDAAFWAQGSTLKVTEVPVGGVNLNVDGRQVVGPLQGFGQMWQKTYQIPLTGAQVTPTVVVKTWKEQFPTFWPKGNHFYGPLTGIAPGEVAVLNLQVAGGMMLSTGVLVIYADDESFTLMTPQGHMFAGWITFTALDDGDCTVAQTKVLVRANDPLYEVGMRLGGYRKEDLFWEHTLQSLAAHFGVRDAAVTMQRECVDPRLQWHEAGNIWQNAAVRTTLYSMSAPVRWVRQRGQR